MSQVEPPEGWTEEEYQAYFGDPSETEQGEFELTSYSTVEVPEGTGGEDQA